MLSHFFYVSRIQRIQSDFMFHCEIFVKCLLQFLSLQEKFEGLSISRLCMWHTRIIVLRSLRTDVIFLAKKCQLTAISPLKKFEYKVLTICSVHQTRNCVENVKRKWKHEFLVWKVIRLITLIQENLFKVAEAVEVPTRILSKTMMKLFDTMRQNIITTNGQRALVRNVHCYESIKILFSKYLLDIPTL